jgi:hypothetical protein
MFATLKLRERGVQQPAAWESGLSIPLTRVQSCAVRPSNNQRAALARWEGLYYLTGAQTHADVRSRSSRNSR